MGALARLAQLEQGAPRHHLAAMAQERLQQILEIEQSRLTVQQAHHVDAEHSLHGGVLIEVVEHHLGHLAATQFDHHTEAVLVGLIAQLGDALDALFLDQLGDFLHQPGLVDLVGQFGDHNGLAAAIEFLEVAARAQVDAAAARAIGLADTVYAVDDCAGGEIRPRHALQQVLDLQRRIVDQCQTGIHHLAQVMGRDVGGHAHGDTGGTVDQQVGHAGRHDQRLMFGAVVVGAEIDRFLVQIGQQLVGQLGHADFGIAHGGRRIAVDGAEVALPVHQQIAHGKRLGHAHDGVVHRRVAVRVVFTDDVAHHAGGFLVRLVPVVAELVHGKKHAPMHGFQAVAHIGQRPAHDHAHGVIQIGLTHLVFEIDVQDFFRCLDHALPSRDESPRPVTDLRGES